MTLPRPLLWMFIACAAIFAYAGSFTGEPIWDDSHFIFWVYAHKPNPSHWNFWSHHIWPLFDSVAALLHRWWGPNTLYWHTFNFTLHIINSLLIGKLVSTWRKSWALPLALLFLIHPLNVMSVAWIIQLKTLLCIFFLLLTLFAILRWVTHPKPLWYALALVCFILSVASKSASLPIPWLLLPLFILRRKQHPRWLLALLPFLLITLLSAWRIWSNKQVQAAVTESEVVVEKMIEQPTFEENVPAPVVEVAPTEPAETVVEPVVEVVPTEPAEIVAPPSLPEVVIPPEPTAAVTTLQTPNTLAFGLHNLATYLVMPWFPWPPSPVHGVYKGGIDARATSGLILVVLLLVIAWFKRTWLPVKLLLIQAAILVPYLGFVIVPYMSYTAVSEQHFYLVLPFALALQLWILDFLPLIWRNFLLGVVGALFLAITADYTQSFKNERVFYERLLNLKPYNTLATINLAGHYYHNGSHRQAQVIIEHFMKEAERNPQLKQDALYPIILRAQAQYQWP